MIQETIRLQSKLKKRIVSRMGPLPELRKRYREDRENTLAALIPVLNRECESLFKQSCSVYTDRIKQLVLESLQGERSCPDIVPLPNPMPEIETRLLPAAQAKQAILFDYFPHIGNEVFPFMIDALVSASPPLCCAHVDWLDEEFRLKRAMVYDDANDLLLEFTFLKPVVLESVLYLAMDRRTHEFHSFQAAEYHSKEWNPYSLSAIADSKWLSFQRWIAAGVLTPDTIRFMRNETEAGVGEKIQQFVLQNPTACIVQPDHGTEGRGVTLLQWSGESLDAKLNETIDAIQTILKEDDAVIRQYIPPSCNAAQAAFDLRVNVAYDGERYIGESGYWMTAEAGQGITSPERGGRVMKLHAAEDDLPEHFNKEGVIQEAIATAERAAACFAPIAMLGIDIRIAIGNHDEIGYWVLDANPRPAGSAHAEYFDTREPGVTRVMWK